MHAFPQTPDAGVVTSTVTGVVAPSLSPVLPDRPIEIEIPSINLDDRIIPVGLNAKGEMAVPSGKSSDIGWYENGTVPGDEGSAVLDAHVFAALKNLKRVPVGADIYVVMKSGATKHFVVRQATLYRLSRLTSATLFDHGEGRWLNIITCAGSLTSDRSTYDHRLIVFAELVS